MLDWCGVTTGKYSLRNSILTLKIDALSLVERLLRGHKHTPEQIMRVYIMMAIMPGHLHAVPRLPRICRARAVPRKSSAS